MKAFVASAIVGFASVAQAWNCKDYTVPVTISARNAVFSEKAPVTDIEVTNFILNLTQPGINYTAQVLTGYRTLPEKTYNLATTYCGPADGSQPSVVQLLTHGIGFDRSYWNPTIDNYNYSYSKVAVDKYGFATFSWDRLGIGHSAHGEPVNEIQSQLEIEALHALTQKLRAGTISKDIKAFNKVVHVGHSYGSEHTYALVGKYPNDSDGIALTGFSQNGTYIPYFAFGGNFIQANTNSALKSYVDGYLAAGDVSAVQTNFFAPNAFDPAVLNYAYKTGQPVTIGELLTIGAETAFVNTFAKPVLVITGERDLPYCGGNCLNGYGGYPNIPAAAQKTLPDAKPFKAVLVPRAGHGLNYEYSHPFTYAQVNEFFVGNGVGPAKKARRGL